MPKKLSSAHALISIENLQQKIYLMRGRRVMLDADLADLYQVPTKVFNQAVRRNLNRFPEDFMFQLSSEESKSMRSQIVTASKRNIRYRPYAFTEHGALMLASILKSQRAVQMSIFVVRAFTQLREFLATHKDLARKMDDLERKQKEHSDQLAAVYSIVKQLINPPVKPRRRLGFEPRGEDNE